MPSVSVTSHHSYGSRVGNSLKNILWGILFVIISIVLLVRNENNYVKEKAALNEWASVVQEASATQLDSSLNWKEIHVYGQTASPAEALKDNDFWIETNDLKLKRTVEMYQRDEDEDTECHDNYGWSEDCTTTYTYNKVWSEDEINSSHFHDNSTYSNPSNRRYKSNERTKSPITLWAYTLSQTFVNKLTNYQRISLHSGNVSIPEINQPNPDEFHIQNNYIYFSKNPNSPAIWDLRISFSSIEPWTVSVIGKQLESEIVSYTTSNGRSIALLQQWTVTAEDMFLTAQKENQMMTRILRLVGLIIMFCGFSMMMEFIETIAKVLPFLANIIWVWTRLIAFCLTLVVWFVTIWLAWIAVRPVIGISCLVVAVAWIFLMIKSKNKKKEVNTEVPQWNIPGTTQTSAYEVPQTNIQENPQINVPQTSQWDPLDTPQA